jgi:putative DNA primase/helicase
MDIWQHETFPGNESKAHDYLYSRQCWLDPLPEVIRYRYAVARIGRPHAMACRIDHDQFGSIGIHLTKLRLDGCGRLSEAECRLPREIIGRCAGGAVWLGAPQPDKWLVVGEGIETTLSVALPLGVPGWAALSANGIKSLVLPPEAQMVLVATDNDKDGTGERAANWAAQRWRGEGRAVKVMMPPTVGSDWNTVLMGREPKKRPTHGL